MSSRHFGAGSMGRLLGVLGRRLAHLVGSMSAAPYPNGWGVARAYTRGQGLGSLPPGVMATPPTPRRAFLGRSLIEKVEKSIVTLWLLC
jgi:hypothetical protein